MLNPSQQEFSHLGSPRDLRARPLRDLRISILDRCNFRCSYCMPKESLCGKHSFLPADELLSDEEIERIVRAFTSVGATKIRLTGGEPLLRPGLPALVKRIAAISGVHDLSMTTNGVLLPRLAVDLADAGLDRITISLDSLDESVFSLMTGGKASARQVLEGIAAAEAAGFQQLKINCVVKRGTNDHTVMDMVRHFRGSGHVLRLIEYLDVGNSNDWQKGQVVAGHEWLRRIHHHWPLKPLKYQQIGETAQRYAFEDGEGEIGLINSITQPFCGYCSRARVTADGLLYTCLFASQGTALKPLLGKADGNTDLEALIHKTWSNRDDRYSETRHLVPGRDKGQEMYRMGG